MRHVRNIYAAPSGCKLDFLAIERLDGFGAIAALQKEPGWRDIPVIVITSLELSEDDRTRLSSGVQSVLVKNTFAPGA